MARQASLLLRLLNLPAFLLAVFIMYWSVPLCMLQNRIRPWKLRGPRNDAYGWCARFKIAALRRRRGARARQSRQHVLSAGDWACNDCSASRCVRCRARRCTKVDPASGWCAAGGPPHLKRHSHCHSFQVDVADSLSVWLPAVQSQVLG